MEAFTGFHERREHLDWPTVCRRLDEFYNRRDALCFDWQVTVWARLRSDFRERQTKEMVDLSHRCHGRFAATPRDSLLDRNARRQATDQIDIGFFELLDKLPCIWRHAIKKSTLPLGKQDVERECRFAGTAQSSDHDKLFARNFNVDVFEIVLPRTVNMNGVVWPRERGRLALSVRRPAERLFCRAQCKFRLVICVAYRFGPSRGAS